MFNTLLQAAPVAAEPTAGNALMQFLPIILIFVVFYFFMIRPQQKKQKEIEKMRSELKKGDKVVTTSGLVAKIAEVKEDHFVLEIQPEVKATFLKDAVISLYQEKKN